MLICSIAISYSHTFELLTNKFYKTKKHFLLSLAFFFFVIIGFSQADYKMWETIYIVPKADKIEELKKGMVEYNEKYHNEDPFTAHVWSIHTGRHEGTWLWAMGPTTFADLDNRPAKKGHDEDWDENITPYVEKVYGVKYWKLGGSRIHGRA